MSAHLPGADRPTRSGSPPWPNVLASGPMLAIANGWLR